MTFIVSTSPNNDNSNFLAISLEWLSFLCQSIDFLPRSLAQQGTSNNEAQVASRPLLHVVMKREQQKGVAVLSLRVVVHQHIFVLFMCAVLNCFFCLPNFLLVSFSLYCISCGVSSTFWLISVLCSLDFDFLCCVIDWSHFSSPKNWYVECSKYRVMQKQKYRVMQKQKSLGCCLVIPLFFYRQLSL